MRSRAPSQEAEGARDLVAEVDMTGGVNQVQLIYLPVFSGVGQTDGLAFDGDAPFTFDVHVVEQLVFELTDRDLLHNWIMRSARVDLP